MVVSLKSNKEEEDGRPAQCVAGTEAGSHLRLIDSCITQRKAQGPSRTCNESKEEEEGVDLRLAGRTLDRAEEPLQHLVQGTSFLLFILFILFNLFIFTFHFIL